MTCPICSTPQAHTGPACPNCGFPLAGELPDTPLLRQLDEAVQRDLGDRYTLQYRLRASQDSITWLAEEGDERVIVRAFARNRHTEAAIAQAFSPFMAAVSAMDQPHIVPVMAFDRNDAFAWFARRYVEGESLETRLLTGPLPFEECLPIIEQLASALQFAHRKGVVHGNVQPRNILFDRNGWIFLSDLCAATFSDGARVPARPPTNPRVRYPAPESMQRAPGPASDQYALAMTVCRCLGLAIGPDGDVQATMPGSVTRLPRTAVEAVRRALHPRPAQRFATVLEFVAALGAAEPVEMMPPTLPRGEPMQREIPDLLFVEAPPKRRRWLAAAMFLLLAAAGGFAATRIDWRRSVALTDLARNFTGGDTAAEESTTAGSALAIADPWPAPPTTPRAGAAAGDSLLVPRDTVFVRDTVVVRDTIERLVEQPPRRTEPPQPRTTAATQQNAAAQRAAEDAEEATAPAAPGRLYISSRPWGQIHLDGRPLGNTPKAGLLVPAGEHTLRISRPGFRTWERRLLVTPGQAIRLIDIVLQENR